MANIEIPSLPVTPRVVGPTQPVSLAARLIPAVIFIGLFVWLVVSSVTHHSPYPAPTAPAPVASAPAGPESDTVAPLLAVPAPDDDPTNPLAECLIAHGWTGADDGRSAVLAPEWAIVGCATNQAGLLPTNHAMSKGPRVQAA